MGYDNALNKGWEELSSRASAPVKAVFLGQEYFLDPSSRECVSSSGGREKPYLSILLLHYAAAALKGIPRLEGKWISFRELPAGEFYYPAFRKRALEPLLAKYGKDPREAIAGLCRRLSGIAGELAEGDACVVIEVFPGVPVKIVFWLADAEFPAEATMLFDNTAGSIFCTEDIAVLGGALAANLAASV